MIFVTLLSREDMDVCASLPHCQVSEDPYTTCVWQDDKTTTSGSVTAATPLSANSSKTTDVLKPGNSRVFVVVVFIIVVVYFLPK